MDDTKEEMKCFRWSSYRHARKKGNQEAHALAQYAHIEWSKRRCGYWLGTISAFVLPNNNAPYTTSFIAFFTIYEVRIY